MHAGQLLARRLGLQLQIAGSATTATVQNGPSGSAQLTQQRLYALKAATSRMLARPQIPRSTTDLPGQLLASLGILAGLNTDIQPCWVSLSLCNVQHAESLVH